MRYFRLLLFLLALPNIPLAAQTVLLAENFNDCGTLPTGWQVNINGNQDAKWYIGLPQNSNSNGNTIDGSCMVIIDDDATGENTEGFVWEMRSPAFDASDFTTVHCAIDLHYRDWADGSESFSVWVTDGVSSKKLTELGNDNSTGEQFDEFKTFYFDLAFEFAKPNVQLIFRYDDNSEWNWWAGFDNVRVVADGAGGKNVVLETFDNCQKPSGWETDILSGDDNWLFAPIQNSNYYGIETMNGSCFAFFDDDALGEDAPYSTARLLTPWFDGTEFANFSLKFDVVHRYWRETLTVFVQHPNGEEFEVKSWAEDLGGPLWNNYLQISLDLSPYRNQQMRVIFEYSDLQTWAWWTGIDNVKISGTGTVNDLCSNATLLTTGTNCLVDNNRNAVFEGPNAACAKRSVGGKWYRWVATQSGWHALSTQANFNEVVTVFSGDCNNPLLELCNNRDEHGFTAEKTFFQTIAGKTYLFRVSGQAEGFGNSRGDFCIQIEKTTAPPAAPTNDNCNNAKQLSLDAPCTAGQNLNSNIADLQLPSRDLLARSDVWFVFQAPTLANNEKLTLYTHADFSDIITLWRGGCNNLTEVASSEFGQKLELPNLQAGQNYRIQIAGIFATLEGNFCIELKKEPTTPPSNDDCPSAKSVTIGNATFTSNNENANASGRRPSCAIAVAKDVWFSFVAPLSGAVHIQSAADFEQIAAVWEGPCNNLKEIFCLKNPLRCAGYFTVGELIPGKTYFLQVAATNFSTEFNSGAVAVRILDGIAAPDYFPLQVQVTEICTGIQTAHLSVQTSAGTAPYQITQTGDGQDLSSGANYVVIVRDAVGCETAVSGIVKECTEAECLLNVSVQVQAPLCHNATDGTISVSVQGGTAPFQYNWSVAGATGSQLANLGAGIYHLTVTDAEGCSILLSRTLDNPPAMVASVSGITEPNTGQSNGEITIAVQHGTAPFSYQWLRNGLPFATTQNLFGIPAGNYVLTIADANGCTASLSQILNETVAAHTPADGWAVQIMPNPAQNFTFLDLKMPTTQQVELTFCDAVGKTLWQRLEKNLSSGVLKIELEGLPAGVYQVKIRAGERQFTRKVVVI